MTAWLVLAGPLTITSGVYMLVAYLAGRSNPHA